VASKVGSKERDPIAFSHLCTGNPNSRDRSIGDAAQGTRAVLLIVRTDTAAAAFNQRLGLCCIREKMSGFNWRFQE
jgi:hypothetical protein